MRRNIAHRRSHCIDPVCHADFENGKRWRIEAEGHEQLTTEGILYDGRDDHDLSSNRLVAIYSILVELVSGRTFN